MRERFRERERGVARVRERMIGEIMERKKSDMPEV